MLSNINYDVTFLSGVGLKINKLNDVAVKIQEDIILLIIILVRQRVSANNLTFLS